MKKYQGPGLINTEAPSLEEQIATMKGHTYKLGAKTAELVQRLLNSPDLPVTTITDIHRECAKVNEAFAFINQLGITMFKAEWADKPSPILTAEGGTQMKSV